MRIVPASPNHFAPAIRLLQDSGLPTEDITPGTQLFVVEEGEGVAGTIAVEYDYDTALLRSLSVAPALRGRGLGDQLTSFIEDYLRKQGVQTVFLLTTTAAGFFSKRGYEVVGREEVPDFIKNTHEYSVLCTASSTVMKKQLA